MFSNALISVNWSGTSVAAAALARRLCVDDARLTLAHVHAEVPLSPDPLIMHLRKFELRHSMRALKGAAFATEISSDSTLSVGAPTVGEGLSGLINMIGADLLVLGPLDQRDALVPDLAQWFIDRPTNGLSAIAVAPASLTADAPAPRRIGVICDGSSQGQKVRGIAEGLAASLGSRLKAFEVSPPEARAPGSRRGAIIARRLSEFSARVDLLISGADAQALGHGTHAPLLMIKHPDLPRRPALGTAALARGRSL
jgi:hypothetical protein